MKKLLILLVAALMFLGIGSCVKSPVESMKDKLVGTWTFEKVTYREKAFSKRQDMTWLYENLHYRFYEDGSFLATDLSTGTESEGRWELAEFVSSTDANMVYALHITEMIDGMPTQFQWQVIRITNKKFTASEQRGHEQWEYKLVPF